MSVARKFDLGIPEAERRQIIPAVPDVSNTTNQVGDLASVSLDMTISCNEDYVLAADRLNQCVALRKEIEKQLEPSITAANKAHKTLTALRKRLTAPVVQAEDYLRGIVGDWLTKKAREAEAARRAEEERQRKIAEEAALQRAAEMEAEGAGSLATEVLDAALSAPAPAVKIEMDVPDALSSRDVWKWEVTDATKIPREYFLLDEKRIQREVSALRDNFNVPGIKVWSEKTAIVR